jgi:putative colanic acid biosynthesis UDP-glucose lipid carrier transferase
MSGNIESALLPVGEHWLTVDQEWIYDEAADKRGYFLAKRIFDLSVALLVIAGVLSWLLPLLALLIKLDSKGSVFFVQERMGRHLRPFLCYKLRSMVNGRITRPGGWLRRTHLDELPQFFNVLLGAMSIVGPRPYMPADCRRFAELVRDADMKLVRDADFRHRVKPGITGMAQAKGLHGVVSKGLNGAVNKERRVIVQRYQWDAYYIRHAGFRLDMEILGRTVRLLLAGRGAKTRPIALPSE